MGDVSTYEHDPAKTRVEKTLDSRESGKSTFPETRKPNGIPTFTI